MIRIAHIDIININKNGLHKEDGLTDSQSYRWVSIKHSNIITSINSFSHQPTSWYVKYWYNLGRSMQF